jgi:hypothetical protein
VDEIVPTIVSTPLQEGFEEPTDKHAFAFPVLDETFVHERDVGADFLFDLLHKPAATNGLDEPPSRAETAIGCEAAVCDPRKFSLKLVSKGYVLAAVEAHCAGPFTFLLRQESKPIGELGKRFYAYVMREDEMRDTKREFGKVALQRPNLRSIHAWRERGYF